MRCYAPEPDPLPDEYYHVPHICPECECVWEDEECATECPECGHIPKEDEEDEEEI